MDDVEGRQACDDPSRPDSSGGRRPAWRRPAAPSSRPAARRKPSRKEVIKEVPVETVVTREVIKEVPVQTVVTQEVIREVPVEKVVVQEAAMLPPLIVGQLNAFTGSLSFFGPIHRNAAALAADHVNRAGGVGGGSMIIISRDTGVNPVQGVEAARALVEIENAVAIVGALASGVTIPVATSVTVPNQRVQISGASTAPQHHGARRQRLPLPHRALRRGAGRGAGAPRLGAGIQERRRHVHQQPLRRGVWPSASRPRLPTSAAASSTPCRTRTSSPPSPPSWSAPPPAASMRSSPSAIRGRRRPMSGSRWKAATPTGSSSWTAPSRRR